MFRWHVSKTVKLTRHNNDHIIPRLRQIVKYSLRYVGAKIYTKLRNGTKGAKNAVALIICIVNKNILSTYFVNM